jgi:hypothetical protein
MSGGPKGAKRPLARPLDVRVRRHCLCWTTSHARSCLPHQHGARIVVATNRHDLSVYDADVLRKRNCSEGCIDVEEGDAVLAIDDEANDFDMLDDSREPLRGFKEGHRTPARIHGKDANHLRMNWEVPWIVSTNSIDVFLDHASYLSSHTIPLCVSVSGWLQASSERAAALCCLTFELRGWLQASPA